MTLNLHLLKSAEQTKHNPSSDSLQNKPGKKHTHRPKQLEAVQLIPGECSFESHPKPLKTKTGAGGVELVLQLLRRGHLQSQAPRNPGMKSRGPGGNPAGGMDL